MRDDGSFNGAAREESRSLTVRGLMKVSEKGRDGSASYSVPGNSLPRAREKGMSSLAKE